MPNIFKDNQGATGILLTMLILSSVLMVTLTISDIVKTGLIMGRTQVHSTKAYFASEAGAEKLLWEVRKNNVDLNTLCAPGDFICFDAAIDGVIDPAGECGVICPNFDHQNLSNNATFQIIYDFSAPTTILTSYGNYDNVRRAVELRY